MRFVLLLALIGAVFWALRRSLGEQRQARLAQLGCPGVGAGMGAMSLSWREGSRAVLTGSGVPMAAR